MPFESRHENVTTHVLRPASNPRNIRLDLAQQLVNVLIFLDLSGGFMGCRRWWPRCSCAVITLCDRMEGSDACHAKLLPYDVMMRLQFHRWSWWRRRRFAGGTRRRNGCGTGRVKLMAGGDIQMLKVNNIWRSRIKCVEYWNYNPFCCNGKWCCRRRRRCCR